MNIKLLFSALSKFVCGILLLGILLFLPANTIYFPGAWRFIGFIYSDVYIWNSIIY